MNKRELSFLLIGFGIGLLFAMAAMVLWLHHMFIIGFSWRPGSIVLALPLVLIVVGIVLSRGNLAERNRRGRAVDDPL